jgi:hypothetical protein
VIRDPGKMGEFAYRPGSSISALAVVRKNDVLLSKTAAHFMIHSKQEPY